MNSREKIWKVLETAKLPLEVLAVIAGLIVTIPIAWDYLSPSSKLVAEVIAIQARLPITVVNHANEQPQVVRKQFEERDEVKKIIPDLRTRLVAADAVEKIVEEESYLSPLSDVLMNREVFLATVHNNGNSSLTDVRLHLKSGAMGASYTVMEADESIKIYEKPEGPIRLGDIPPRGTVKVYGWGFGFFLDNLLITHRDGVGDIWRSVLVPESLWQGGGWFFSYRDAAVFLVGAILLSFGSTWLIRRSRKKKTIKAELVD